MKRHISLLPSVIVMCSVVNCHSVRGNNDALMHRFSDGSSDVHLHRSIEEKQYVASRLLEEDEADESNDEADAEQDDEVEVTDDDENANNESTSTIDDMKSKVQAWEATAESSAWEFYQSPPSEWSTAQWDVFLGILLSFFLTCCVASACCAHCCLKRNDDGDKNLASPRKNNRNTRQYGSGSKRRNGRSRSRGRRRDDDDDYYNRYEDDSGDEGYTPKAGCLV